MRLLTPSLWIHLLGTRDGRELIAIGCDEGVWIGLRGNLKC